MDPGELNNLYRQASPRTEIVMERMNNWTAAMPRINSPRVTKPTDRSMLEKLRSLGYIQ